MISPALNISPFAEYMDTTEMLYQVDYDFKTAGAHYLTNKSGCKKFEERLDEDRHQELEYKLLTRNLAIPYICINLNITK
jgi:hypothetical protein